MPASDWNRRLWGIGNGDFAGSISQEGLASRLAEGYATVGTDTGHQTASQYETAWASGHPEKVVDFAHRGIHLAALNAKRIISEFYGRRARHTYFASCSNGGRQARMEAERYPDDYDGIIAGAPAADWTHLYIGAGLMYFRWLAQGPSYLPANKLPAIHAAVLAACDELDHVKDGVIEDPRRCQFDPSVLLCKGTESDVCLSSAQLSSRRSRIFTPVPHFTLASAFGPAIHLELNPDGAMRILEPGPERPIPIRTFWVSFEILCSKTQIGTRRTMTRNTPDRLSSANSRESSMPTAQT